MSHIRSPLVELTCARFREFAREPEAMFWAFVFPVLITCALGIAFRSGGNESISVGIAQTEGHAAVEAPLAGSGFTIRLIAPDDIERAIRDGRVAVVVVPGKPPVYRFDAVRPESLAARLAVDAALQRAAGRTDVFQPAEQPIEAIGSRYVDWLVPGLVGMNIMSTGLWSVAFAIGQARMKKLLKRLVATPMSRWQYLLSHMLNRLVFLTFETAVILIFAWFAFDVAVRGSFMALTMVALVGALTFGAMALLVSSRARTIEAVSGLLNVVMLPMWILSGVFFASSNFPDAMQPFVQALPLTALVDALRGVINEGMPLASLASELGILSAWGVASFVLALKLFRWH